MWFDLGKAGLVLGIVIVAAGPRLAIGTADWAGVFIAAVLFPAMAGFGWPLARRVWAFISRASSYPARAGDRE